AAACTIGCTAAASMLSEHGRSGERPSHGTGTVEGLHATTLVAIEVQSPGLRPPPARFVSATQSSPEPLSAGRLRSILTLSIPKLSNDWTPMCTNVPREFVQAPPVQIPVPPVTKPKKGLHFPLLGILKPFPTRGGFTRQKSAACIICGASNSTAANAIDWVLIVLILRRRRRLAPRGLRKRVRNASVARPRSVRPEKRRLTRRRQV